MHIKFFLEEPSAEEALKHLLPKILLKDVSYEFHTFQGRDEMLKELPKRLKGEQWIPNDWRIVVLIFLKTLFDSIVTSVLVGFVHENARG